MSSVSGMTNDTGLSGGELDESVTQKAVFEKRTEEEQQEIQQNLEEFKATNEQAERELEKWDDSQVRVNDLYSSFNKSFPEWYDCPGTKNDPNHASDDRIYPWWRST